MATLADKIAIHGPSPGPGWIMDADGNIPAQHYSRGVPSNTGWVQPPGGGTGNGGGGTPGTETEELGLFNPSGGSGSGGGGGGVGNAGLAGGGSGGIRQYGDWYDVEQLDGRGLQTHRPLHQQLWTKLQNVLFRRGSLRSRPGLNEIEADNLPLEGGRPLVITEIYNPGSEKSRDNFEISILDAGTPTDYEVLRPVATVDAGRWIRSDVTGPAAKQKFEDILARDVGHNSSDDIYLSGDSAFPDAKEFTVRMSMPQRITSVSYVRLKIVSSEGNLVNGLTSIFDIRRSDGTLLATMGGDAEMGTVFEKTHIWGETDDDVTFSDLTGGGGCLVRVSGNIGNFDNVRLHALSLELYKNLPNVPVADVLTTGWTGFTPGNAYTELDEVDFGGTSDDIRLTGPNATGKPLELRIASFTTAPGAVEIFCRFKCVDLLIPDHEIFTRLYLKDSSGNLMAEMVNFYVAAVNGNQPAYVMQKRFDKNAFTNAAFTVADLTDPVLGFEVTSEANSASYRVQMEQMFVQGLTLTSTESLTLADCNDVGPENGIAGRHRLMVSSTNFVKLVDETSTTGYTSVRGGVELPETLTLDHGFLYGQVYLAAGCQDVYRYPNENNVFEQLVGRPKGRTVAGFANRILLGWTTDAGETVPERIIYSDFQDGGKYDGTSAGDLDVIATPGGIVKLLPLTEDSCACYKEVGIYRLRATGDDTNPIIPELVDGETGCIALRTVQATIAPNGNPVHFFLGRNATSGFNVFSFDGSSVIAIGDGISSILMDRLNVQTARLSFGGIDPDGNNYWLVVPLDSESFPQSAFTFNLLTHQWCGPHTFDKRVSAIGQWTFANQASAIDGRPSMMLGSADDGHPYKFDYDVAYDINTRDREETFNDDQESHGFDTQFPMVIETGDLRYGDPTTGAIAYRARFHFINRGTFKVTADVSHDGGVSFTTATEKILGSNETADDGAYMMDFIDITPDHGRRLRFRFTMGPEFSEPEQPVFELSELFFEVKPAGDQP